MRRRSWLARPGLMCIALLVALLPVLSAVYASAPPPPDWSALTQTGGEIQFVTTATPTAIMLRMTGGVPPYAHTVDVPPAHGTLEAASDTVLIYTSQAGYTGPDSFTYTLFDGAGAHRTAVVVIQVVAAASSAPPGVQLALSPDMPEPPRLAQAAASEYIVHYPPGAAFQDVQAMVSASGGTIIQHLPQINAVVVHAAAPAAIALQSQGLTFDVEPNLLRYPLLTPNDPGLGSQWGLNAIHAYNAWDVTTGTPSSVIAVLDTGVDLDHPDLAANLLAGYDAAYKTTNAQDYHGHGTHVAGTANARTNNGTGVAGVAWEARTLPVKVMDAGGAITSAYIAAGLIYAADQGAKVVNMSLGGPGFVKLERDAINYAVSRGVVVIAAAGNYNTDTPYYPASYDHVISVASTNETNQKSDFSNYGQYIDIAAPGSNIYNTYYNNTYATMSGTSMATPQVAGVAALVWSAGHATTWREVVQALLCTAFDLGAAGRDNYFGWGLVQADNAVNYVPGTSCLPTVAHDDFAAARAATGTTYTDTASTGAATSWADDPVLCAGDGSHTVWYTYTPLGGGIAVIDTVGSSYDTVMGLYTGTRGSLVQVACNDNADGATSRITATLAAGKTYYLAVSSKSYTGGAGTLKFNLNYTYFPPAGCGLVGGAVVCTSN